MKHIHQDIDALQEAVQKMHDVTAEVAGQHWVEETFAGDIVWEGPVQAFTITGHAEADTCYAWASPGDDPKSDKVRYFAVLHMPPVDSPSAAVRAAIASRFRSNQPP